MELSRPFIRLPFAFDAGRLAEEVGALAEGAWMAHPSGMKGNSAVALISRGGDDNDDFDGKMSVTRHLQSCPYTQQVMAGFDEVLGRSRFMRLAPSCEVSTHVDFNYHWYSRVRIHIPVITEPEVIFYCADEQVHMKPGECWIFDSWRRHRVVNGGAHDRIHLVIDTAGSSRFWGMVREMEAIARDADPAAFEAGIRRIPFEPDRSVTLETERYNTAPVMAPGEVDALVADLVRDFSANPDNDPVLVAEYRLKLADFSKDWREAWLRFGYSRSGFPHYGRLIQTLRGGLHPDPRALVTRSNEVGVNPIIVQRILRSALAPEQLDQFLSAAGSGE
jgi:hypothetical protein